MIIRVRVIPNATENDIVGRIGSTIRLKVASPAIDGNANMELCSFLAEFFEVKSKMVKIVRGEKGREKTVEIEGRREEDLKKMMEAIP
ncbi:MAG: YggU family protein [Elusimicrobia bacterium RIFCSPLOWO2_02_FULL_39_32]|nr:MAG: YggU family protein [Elusimicrobia bacterium GWA2_38_7]OGR78227.1 MAG: YggU family protein [Elusimicrobia bacterium RIFCSPHIGHO2_02_FULL_39_36]OGR92365.1 MAG: YggU family protein [Elusimicrobia bacterium RIFCSPLOWO2_02_FULL_39_32]OGR98908.1 MAG: YggU family protein [Elusimicrobia bacterium RIFCSPLOWO2_12_FULL_39_28]